MDMRFGAWGVVSVSFPLFVSWFPGFLYVGVFVMMVLLCVIWEVVKVVAMNWGLGLGDGTSRRTSSVELALSLAQRRTLVPGIHVAFGLDSLIEHACGPRWL
jgi:uncharacterized membrane protein